MHRSWQWVHVPTRSTQWYYRPAWPVGLELHTCSGPDWSCCSNWTLAQPARDVLRIIMIIIIQVYYIYRHTHIKFTLTLIKVMIIYSYHGSEIGCTIEAVVLYTFNGAKLLVMFGHIGWPNMQKHVHGGQCIRTVLLDYGDSRGDAKMYNIKQCITVRVLGL